MMQERMTNADHENNEGFSHHLMPDLQHVVMAMTFPVPVEELYSCVFGEDSSMYLDWMENQQAINIKTYPWLANGDNKERRLDYQVKLKDHSLFVPDGIINMNTDQVRFSSSEDGVGYVVDNHNYMEGVPFAESFHSVARHSLRSLSHNSSELRVSVDVRFKEPQWIFLQDLVEDIIFPEYEEDYKALSEKLKTRFIDSTAP